MGMKTKKIWLGAAFIVLLWLLPSKGLSEIYKYVDDKGVVNFTDNYYKVPEKYRDRAQRVQSQIQTFSPQTPSQKLKDMLTGEAPFNWEDFAVRDQEGNIAGLNLKAMLLQALFKSRLIYWFGGTVVFTIIMLILFLTYRNWPTARGRMMAMIGISLGWLGCTLLIGYFFTIPSARNFLATSRFYLSEVLTKAPIDDQSRKVILSLDAKFAGIEQKLK